MKIRTQFVLALLLVSGLAFSSCKKDSKKDNKVDDNGLTQDINQLIPDSILTIMQNLGMPINGGETPPSLEGTYFASPFVLKSSNIPSDTPGYTFADYTVTFYEQNNDQLSIKMDYTNGPESGSGLGGFIVGAGDKFSVFAEVNSTYSIYSAKLVHVISGTLTGTGITGLYFANFMIDNNGNPGAVWIENGEGRVIYDSDGSSPKVTEKTSPAGSGKTASVSASLVQLR